MSEVPKLERFNKKQVLRNDQLLFILHEKNEFFKLTDRRVSPTTGVGEL